MISVFHLLPLVDVHDGGVPVVGRHNGHLRPERRGAVARRQKTPTAVLPAAPTTVRHSGTGSETKRRNKETIILQSVYDK